MRVVGHAVGHEIGKLLTVWCGQVTLGCVKPLLLLRVRNKIKASRTGLNIGGGGEYSSLSLRLCIHVPVGVYEFVCLPQ